MNHRKKVRLNVPRELTGDISGITPKLMRFILDQMPPDATLCHIGLNLPIPGDASLALVFISESFVETPLGYDAPDWTIDWTKYAANNSGSLAKGWAEYAGDVLQPYLTGFDPMIGWHNMGSQDPSPLKSPHSFTLEDSSNCTCDMEYKGLRKHEKYCPRSK